MYNIYNSPSSTIVVFCRTQLSRIAISCPHAIDPTSNNKLVAIQSISLLHRRASIIKKIHKCQGQSHDWSRDALLVHLFSRRYLGDFSARNRREIIVMWTVLISRRFLGEKSPISRREISVMWTGHKNFRKLLNRKAAIWHQLKISISTALYCIDVANVELAIKNIKERVLFKNNKEHKRTFERTCNIIVTH